MSWAPVVIVPECRGHVPPLVATRLIAGRSPAERRRRRRRLREAVADAQRSGRADGSRRRLALTQRRATLRIRAVERAFSLLRAARARVRMRTSARVPSDSPGAPSGAAARSSSAAGRRVSFAAFASGSAAPADGSVLLPPPPLRRAAGHSLWQRPQVWAGWGGIAAADAYGCAALRRGVSPRRSGDVACGALGEALAPVFVASAPQVAPALRVLAPSTVVGLAASAAQWHPSVASAAWRAADAWALRMRQVAGFCAVDLGCGGGGWAVGGAAAGMAVIGGVDGCPSAIATYRLNHPAHGAAVIDILDVDAVCVQVAAWHQMLGAGRRLVLLASPPCQPHSFAGRGEHAADPRLKVLASMVRVALRLSVAAVLFENVERFVDSATWLRAASDLREAGYHVDHAVVDAGQLGLPQRRRRVICIAFRGEPSCSMRAAADAVAAQPRVTVSQFFPGRRWFYHLHRRSWGQCVYDAQAHQVPVLRTNCTYFPADIDRYRPRLSDDAPLAVCEPWSSAELGACQGFPLDYIWPPDRQRCRCRFLLSLVVPFCLQADRQRHSERHRPLGHSHPDGGSCSSSSAARLAAAGSGNRSARGLCRRCGGHHSGFPAAAPATGRRSVALR